MGVPKIAIDYGSGVPAGMSREEWEVRVLLAACYRVFAHLGWTEMIYNHITLRVPGPEKHLLINPFGLHYTEVTASNLVKIDLDGNILSDSRWPINPAGSLRTPPSIATSIPPTASCTPTPRPGWRWPAPGEACP